MPKREPAEWILVAFDVECPTCSSIFRFPAKRDEPSKLFYIEAPNKCQECREREKEAN